MIRPWALLATLPLASCGGSAKPTRTVVVLFDMGDSTMGMRPTYQKEFARLIGGFSGGERLIMDGFAFNARATSAPSVHDFLSKKSNPTPFQQRKAIESEAKRAAEDLRQRFARAETNAGRKVPTGLPTHTQTDLIGAIANAVRYFHDPRGEKTERRLVIFSDMIEQSARVDLTGVSMNPKELDALVKRVVAPGVPDLKGVEVWVVGAGADPTGSLSPTRLTRIETFWKRVFKASGTELYPARYSTTLMGWD